MQQFVPPPALYWIRKDLRICDNHALTAASSGKRPVLPIYIHEDNGAGPLGAAQAWWLEQSLIQLSKRYQALGGQLLLKSGNPLEILTKLCEETGAKSVFWNRRYDSDGIQIDVNVKTTLRANGKEVTSFPGHILHEPSNFKTKTGGPYKVYTPFWNAFSNREHVRLPVDPPENITWPNEFPASEDLSNWALYTGKPDWAAEFSASWTPGENGATKRLQHFIDNVSDKYSDRRDHPADAATSLLSPHLALGEISPATIWHRANESICISAQDKKKFLQELLWRDFSYHLLFYAPDLAKRNWNSRFDKLVWRHDDVGFEAWARGETGYPIVDAGMRQLKREGYMHNRVRMIAASFLIKDLMIDWRRGEAWFRDTLVDADPASNAASWQWVAGSGADASPFFRVFNPVLQGRKFDADGNYIRTYVPELQNMPSKYIHAPFEAPISVLEDAGVTLGQTYREPIVDHKFARSRALAAFATTKD